MLGPSFVWRCCLQFCLPSLCSFKFLFSFKCNQASQMFHIDSSWCMVPARACFTIPRFACAIWWVLQKKCLQDCEFHMSDTAGSVVAPSLKGSLEIQENDQRRGQKKTEKPWMLHQAGGCIGTRAVVVVVVVVPQAFGKPPFSPPQVSAFPAFRG